MLARCYHCQQTFDAPRFGVQKCPHCAQEVLLSDPGAPQPTSAPPSPAAGGGQELPPPPPGPAWGSPPPWSALPPGAVPGPPPPGEGESAPFAERARLGFVSSFAQTWRLAALEPARFFRLVKIGQSGSAVLFGVVAFTLGSWVALLFSLATGSATSGMLQGMLRRLPRGGGLDPDQVMELVRGGTLAQTLVQFVATPVVGAVGIYLVSGIIHLALMALRGAGRGFDATLTVVGYGYGLYLLAAVPACGGLIAAVWFMVVAIVGLAEAQRCGNGKATAAVLAPLLLTCLCACAAAAMVAAGVGSFLGHMGQGGTGI